MSRPYLTKSVDQLEELLETHGSDTAVLHALAIELAFRRTARAKELEGEVRRLLAPFADGIRPKPELVSGPPSDCASPPPESADPKRLSPVSYSNHAPHVLDAWSALEVLSPYTYRRPVDLANGIAANLVSIAGGRLPWDGGSARSKPNYRVYFHVVLGTIAAESAFDALVKRFNDSRIERPSVKGDIVLASLLVDKDGVLAGDFPVSISAFGWGLPIALNGTLRDLANWTSEEGPLVKGLRSQVEGGSEGDGPVPLTMEALQRAFAWLIETLELPTAHVEGPRFAVAAYMPFRSRIVPDPMLLNSFYLRDLAKAKAAAEAKKLPEALALYLGERRPRQRQDVLNDPAALDGSLAPGKVPVGRWPAPTAHSPALLQQSAVNLAAALHGRRGILGVNGPPGTGKSTLLRDVVADLVTRRAEAMCVFADPATAFKVSWSRRAKGETVELHALDPSLRGFEMIVASSNNKAVENVSAELPALRAIPADSTLRHFAPLAEDLLERDAWGLIAAVLGNGTNRSRFRKKFWLESRLSFKHYLEHAAGIPGTNGGSDGLADLCNAPSNAGEARDRWNVARQTFQNVSGKAAARLAELEQLRVALAELPGAYAQVVWCEGAHAEGVEALSRAEAELAPLIQAVQKASRDLEGAEAALASHGRQRPKWFLIQRLVGSSAAKAWLSALEPLDRAKSEAQEQHRSAQRAQVEGNRRVTDGRNVEQALLLELEHALRARAALENRCERIQVGAGGRPLDEAFHLQPHAEKQMAAPWLDSELQALRVQVFEVAMGVHKAFIDAAARPLLHNLNALMMGSFNVAPDRHTMLGDLWSSFFLVVPVVSTTFASVERMLGAVPPETFGWLLIDEAGQATPQSAVGALLRCQRAIVVGDPQQVEPVVPLPDVLTSAVLREFQADPDRFGAPAASVQTLADDASEHCATFATAHGSRTVGAPLLVHRRCDSPMFDVSNRIAYGGLMVQAKRPAPSAIRDALGSSRWIDIRGSAQDKFSPEEGEEVIALLRALRAAGVAPDLYIVTPFVAVQDGLRQMVTRSGLLQGWVENPTSWGWERIGTVHTVQGREAEAVIFVLGAPEPGQNGARQWAGGMPNLLNVAVTRAKEVLYVIGNRSAWAEAGHFGVLDRHLP